MSLRPKPNGGGTFKLRSEGYDNNELQEMHTHTHREFSLGLWFSSRFDREISLFAKERAKMRDLREGHWKRELGWERHKGWEERNGY